MKQLISIDIGSTYTKGIVAEPSPDHDLNIAAEGSVPTHSESLYDSVEQLIAGLTGIGRLKDAVRQYDFSYSSSAKGGLAVTAIGVVPDLTLEAAQLAALSAGARVTDVFAYKLTADDIVAIELEQPDIVLLTGGTDGGNESYILHNAEQLAEANLNVPIIFAGNRAIKERVAHILRNKECYLVDNVLPDLNSIDPEPARQKIREVFLQQIVHGKGLDRLIEVTGELPRPTPYAMFEYVKKIHEYYPAYGDFCLIDSGGATTDFYSCVNSEEIVAGAVFKGHDEPVVKRTVEGDLGLRINAAGVWNRYKAFFKHALEQEGLIEAFEAYIERISSDHSYLPADRTEQRFDYLLQLVCCAAAMDRHGGTLDDCYTAQGKVQVQRGRNLKAAGNIIATGGLLAKSADINCYSFFHFFEMKDGRQRLLPESCNWYFDRNYLLPLLANVAFVYPQAAVLKGLKEINIKD